MKVHTTPSIRSTLTVAFATLLSAAVATGCGTDEQPDNTLQFGSENVQIDVVQPNPAIQCQDGRLISVWTKPNAGNGAATPVRPGTDQECGHGPIPDGGAAPLSPPAAVGPSPAIGPTH